MFSLLRPLSFPPVSHFLSLVLLFSPLRPLSFPTMSHVLLILIFNFSFTLPVLLLVLSTINLAKSQLFHEIVTRMLILAVLLLVTSCLKVKVFPFNPAFNNVLFSKLISGSITFQSAQIPMLSFLRNIKLYVS